MIYQLKLLLQLHVLEKRQVVTAKIQKVIRQHQFYKVELVSIVENDKCADELERMSNAATTILDELKLPYRKLFYVLVIWVLAPKKRMTLRFAPSKIDIERFQAVHLVVHSKQGE